MTSKGGSGPSFLIFISDQKLFETFTDIQLENPSRMRDDAEQIMGLVISDIIFNKRLERLLYEFVPGLEIANIVNSIQVYQQSSVY